MKKSFLKKVGVVVTSLALVFSFVAPVTSQAAPIKSESALEKAEKKFIKKLKIDYDNPNYNKSAKELKKDRKTVKKEKKIVKKAIDVAKKDVDKLRKKVSTVQNKWDNAIEALKVKYNGDLSSDEAIAEKTQIDEKYQTLVEKYKSQTYLTEEYELFLKNIYSRIKEMLEHYEDMEFMGSFDENGPIKI